MSEELITTNTVYKHFRSEWWYEHYCTPWVEFILSKDLGIKPEETDSLNFSCLFDYIIIDPKKWMIAKMKYNL